jgi:CHAT domain-containing protein/tetratricopeptide (TPR) repeat protein
MPLIQIQASPDALCVGKEVKHYAGMVSPAQETQQTPQLESGKPIERELTGSHPHSYQMTLATGHYAKLVVDQRGIDVVVKLFGPDGEQITGFDSEIRMQGQESAFWVAEKGGIYRLDVQAKYKNAAAGRYEIRMVELRRATENDRNLHEALKLNTEFLKLFLAGKGDKAQPFAERALGIRERVLGPEHPDVAGALNNLAVIYSNKGDFAKAEPLLQRALSMLERVLGPEHPNVGDSLNNLASLYRNRGDYAKAEPLLQRALSMLERVLGPEHPKITDPLNNLALLYKDRGDFAKAEPLLQRALTIDEKVLGSEHPNFVSSLGNLAIIYYEIGDYAKAETLLQRALTIGEKVLGPEHPYVAECLVYLANVYKIRGRYAEAETLQKRELTISEKVFGPEHPNFASSLGNLAIIYHERADFAKAELLYQRSITILEKSLGPEHPIFIGCLNNLALLYYDEGNYAKAEPLFQRTLTIAEKVRGSEHHDVAYYLNNLANLYRDRGDYAKAEPIYQRALTIREKVFGPEHHEVAFSLNNLATLHLRRGDHAKAESLYQRSLTIWENLFGSEHPNIAASLNGLVELYAAKGDITQAVTFLSRANAVEERNFALNLTIGSERQKLAYLARFSEGIDLTLSLQSQAAPNDPQSLDLAFTTLLRRKGRGLDAMTDTIATLRRHATPQDKELFDKLTQARSQLAALTLKEPDAADSNTYQTRLESLKEKVDELEGELGSRSDKFRRQTQPVTPAAVQTALPAGSALVEFAYFTQRDPQTRKKKPPRYFVYVLAAPGLPKWVDLGEAALINSAVEAWRKALRNPNRTDVKRRARALDERVMRPVRSLLDQMPGQERRLLIAPDGSLNLIPFAALVDERNRYLIESYSISYLTSGRDLLRLQTAQPSSAPPLVMANPDFGRFTTIAMRGGQNSNRSRTRNRARAQIDPTQFFFQPLPATEDEALAIKALLPQASLLRREDATEAALKQAKGPQILHIATHGFFIDYQEPSPKKVDPRKIASPANARLASGKTASHTVQLEAIPSLETAREKVKQLKALGVDAYIVKSEVNGKGIFFRVRVGNFPTQAQANNYGAALKAKGVLSQFFVARYQPPERELLELSPTIAGTDAKPADSQSFTELPSDLRLSKFVALVKDPLLRSGLALAGANHGKSGDEDGILTALEAAYLDLSGTKLVVLSACDTGVGEVKNGEGVQGLRRALVLAGSESQVMSLWPVSDEATKDLMIPYYKALLQGEGRSEGLRQVQLRMLRGREDLRHPFYWAAFIQSGEWASLDEQK